MYDGSIQKLATTEYQIVVLLNTIRNHNQIGETTTATRCHPHTIKNSRIERRPQQRSRRGITSKTMCSCGSSVRNHNRYTCTNWYTTNMCANTQFNLSLNIINRSGKHHNIVRRLKMIVLKRNECILVVEVSELLNILLVVELVAVVVELAQVNNI